jgi:hypothetical protein
MKMSVQQTTLGRLIALVLINGLLLAPRWLLAGSLGPAWIALESLLVVGLFAVLPRRRGSTALAAGVAVGIVLLGVLTFADAVTRGSIGRPLNLYLDFHLVSSVHKLLNGMLGPAVTVLLMLGTAMGAALVILILAYLLSPVEGHSPKPHSRIAGIALLSLFAIGLVGQQMSALTGRVTLPAVELVTDQTRYFVLMLDERERFSAELAAAPDSYSGAGAGLDTLVDRNVVLAFIESYGVSALYDPPFSPLILSRLDLLEKRMADAGLGLATGTLMAPTQGGESWFSHGSLLSGLWLDNQLRYDLMLASGRETLIDDFRRAGHRTVALMPAISLAWPEGERLGYDQIFSSQNIDYAGPPLNWVTMPDQFTWSFLQHTILPPDEDDARPVFAEIGLISSHAPWTPILSVLDDWDSIGDGSVFAPWENAGELPDELWRDMDRVREHYALSVDYALDAMTSYAERYVDDQTFLIVLGDHQAAPVIIGHEADRAVPMHVFSRDPALLQPFLDWGFQSGALPDPDQPPPGMDTFRDWFIRAFSKPTGLPQSSLSNFE